MERSASFASSFRASYKFQLGRPLEINKNLFLLIMNSPAPEANGARPLPMPTRVAPKIPPRRHGSGRGSPTVGPRSIHGRAPRTLASFVVAFVERHGNWPWHRRTRWLRIATLRSPASRSVGVGVALAFGTLLPSALFFSLPRALMKIDHRTRTQHNRTHRTTRNTVEIRNHCTFC